MRGDGRIRRPATRGRRSRSCGRAHAWSRPWSCASRGSSHACSAALVKRRALFSMRESSCTSGDRWNKTSADCASCRRCSPVAPPRFLSSEIAYTLLVGSNDAPSGPPVNRSADHVKAWECKDYYPQPLSVGPKSRLLIAERLAAIPSDWPAAGDVGAPRGFALKGGALTGGGRCAARQPRRLRNSSSSICSMPRAAARTSLVAPGSEPTTRKSVLRETLPLTVAPAEPARCAAASRDRWT